MFLERPTLAQHYATAASKHAWHKQPNMWTERDSAQTWGRRVEIADGGDLL